MSARHTIQPVFEAGLHDLAEEHVTAGLSRRGRRSQGVRPALVAGIVAGADSISDLGVIRHGGTLGPGRSLSDLDALRHGGVTLGGLRARLLVKLRRAVAARHPLLGHLQP